MRNLLFGLLLMGIAAQISYAAGAVANRALDLGLVPHVEVAFGFLLLLSAAVIGFMAYALGEAVLGDE